ncbi:transporter substrate-binding domain-containing protein [Ruegeria atlantica]|uniref:transporter substrate-binding domain-containing protein n=1 Tax=Ruegeria atlantica TaxID=81569 RepID=UPI0014798ED2|nr:transporter substrate-binding domain-containing protein [Ruegeria atlantica]
MNRIFGMALAAGMSLAAIAVPAAQAETIRVGTTCTYFPFNFKDSDGNLSGYDVDVAKEVVKRIGAEVEFVCQAWDGLIPAILSEKFDLIVASMSITPDRMKKLDFSVPYRISEGRLIGRVDAEHKLFNEDGTPIVEAFDGLRLGLPRSSVYDRWTDAFLPEAEILGYDSPDSMYLDLQNGRVDLIFTNPMKAHLSFLSADGIEGFEFVSPAINDPEYFGTGAGIALRKGNEDLQARLDAALTEMREDGTLDEFSLRYFPFAIYPDS